MGAVAYLTLGNKSSPATELIPTPVKTTVKPAVVTTDETADSTSLTEQDLNNIFDLSRKETGTKIYYSDKLGVGFTYMPNRTGTTFTVKVTEIGNKIYVHGVKEKPEDGQSIEIFLKDSEVTLEKAIEAKFLNNYNPQDCFVKTNTTNETQLPNYISAEISFPQNSNPDPNTPWWANVSKCPKNYSQTNGVQYFLANKDVPNKFLFAKIGQAAIASDGTPRTTDGGFNWSHSIRILK